MCENKCKGLGAEVIIMSKSDLKRIEKGKKAKHPIYRVPYADYIKMLNNGKDS